MLSGSQMGEPARVQGFAATNAGITVVSVERYGLSCELPQEGFFKLFGFQPDPILGFSGACRIDALGCELLDHLEVPAQSQ